MTTLEFTDIASVRMVNPLLTKEVFIINIEKTEKFANTYAKVDLVKEVSKSHLSNFTCLVKDLDGGSFKFQLKKALTTIFNLLNYPEGLSVELSSGTLEAVHFTFTDLEEASKFVLNCVKSEVLPKEHENLIVSIGGRDVVVPSRGVHIETVRDEISKEMEKFTGKPDTPETRKLITSIVKSIVNKHAFSYGKRTYRY